MSDDWRDRRVARLESDLIALRSDMWTLEGDVQRRFWERDQRRLQFVGWVLVGLLWIVAALSIAAAAIKG